MKRLPFLVLLIVALLFALRQFRPEPDRERSGPYDHDRFATQPTEYRRAFQAFVSSFDGDDDDTGDGRPDTLSIPQWVAYEMRRHTGPLQSGERPSRWTTDPELAAAGLAPEDDTYRYSQDFRRQHSDWYVRGHLAMKYHAERIGNEAARQTHTLLNAVPQRAKFNSGIWQDLECRTGAWANQHGAVWIVTGPVFYPERELAWIGETEKGERLAAIPHALFKVVARETDDPERPAILGFIYPQQDDTYARGPYPHARYLASVDSIEALTGLDLFSSLPEEIQRQIESARPAELWSIDPTAFTEGCQRSRSYAEKTARGQ